MPKYLSFAVPIESALLSEKQAIQQGFTHVSVDDFLLRLTDKPTHIAQPEFDTSIILRELDSAIDAGNY